MISTQNKIPACTQPRFRTNQMVHFVGGMGKIKNYRPNSATWTYAVEMEMGREPEMGRVGFETTILLDEADIEEVIN
ncbi:MAG: hypothetical protein KME38_13545 [Spirirestis rafaelensis WJT71-NPBG6]|nr:hypothetical protein [Spirirestis rafaelensis WJT71-NPBG6]